MTTVVVEDLHKSYGDFEAVKGISFRVDPGEVVAVLGPNGAGKTTTIEILEGYRERSSGNVQVLGMDPALGGSELRQRIGIILQECGVEPYLTVKELVTEHAEYYRSPRKVDGVIELVGLADRADSRVKTLSGGLKRRLDLALGLIGDPELIFLDEPTTGFDPSARRQAWDTVRSLCDLGKTVLLTTHYMEEAQELANRVIVIASGRIVAEGSPEEIGGRSTADVHIKFMIPDGASPVELPVKADSVTNGEVLLQTADPTRVLHELTAWALERRQQLVGLTVTRPSLEDVYLELTSESAKEGAA